jgi:NADPH:quinone reductase-like Zn-dependent oxidoreductase
MKAVQLDSYGARTLLQTVEIERPSIFPNQLLIKIEASAVNPIDIKIRSGMMAKALPKNFPIILGWEASGIVEEIGSEVTSLKTNDEVYFMPNFIQGGTYAEYVSVNENEVALKPKSLNYIEAAGIPMVAGAAYTSIVKLADTQSGQKVLIHGAAGAVGCYALQMAKARGAYVIGTASGPGLDLLKSLGVDEIIDYKTIDFSTTLESLDVVLDLVGGETLMKSFPIIQKGGLLLSTVMPPSQDEASKHGIKAQMVFTAPDTVMLDEIAQWIDRGKLITQESFVLELEQAQKAHEMIENRTSKKKIVFKL